MSAKAAAASVKESAKEQELGKRALLQLQKNLEKLISDAPNNSFLPLEPEVIQKLNDALVLLKAQNAAISNVAPDEDD